MTLALDLKAQTESPGTSSVPALPVDQGVKVSKVERREQSRKDQEAPAFRARFIKEAEGLVPADTASPALVVIGLRDEMRTAKQANIARQVDRNTKERTVSTIDAANSDDTQTQLLLSRVATHENPFAASYFQKRDEASIIPDPQAIQSLPNSVAALSMDVSFRSRDEVTTNAPALSLNEQSTPSNTLSLADHVTSESKPDSLRTPTHTTSSQVVEPEMKAVPESNASENRASLLHSRNLTADDSTENKWRASADRPASNTPLPSAIALRTEVSAVTPLEQRASFEAPATSDVILSDPPITPALVEGEVPSHTHGAKIAHIGSIKSSARDAAFGISSAADASNATRIQLDRPASAESPSPARNTAHAGGASDLFTALDSAGTEHATWTHASSRQAEAGFNDPSLGWVSVRADFHGGALHAAVLTSSLDAASNLRGELDGLRDHLGERHISLSSLSVSTSTAQHAPDHQPSQRGEGERNSQNQQPYDQPAHQYTSTIASRSQVPPSHTDNILPHALNPGTHISVTVY